MALIGFQSCHSGSGEQSSGLDMKLWYINNIWLNVFINRSQLIELKIVNLTYVVTYAWELNKSFPFALTSPRDSLIHITVFHIFHIWFSVCAMWQRLSCFPARNRLWLFMIIPCNGGKDLFLTPVSIGVQLLNGLFISLPAAYYLNN